MYLILYRETFFLIIDLPVDQESQQQQEVGVPPENEENVLPPVVLPQSEEEDLKDDIEKPLNGLVLETALDPDPGQELVDPSDGNEDVQQEPDPEDYPPVAGSAEMDVDHYQVQKAASLSFERDAIAQTFVKLEKDNNDDNDDET
jgi:hypothetical protein